MKEKIQLDKSGQRRELRQTALAVLLYMAGFALIALAHGWQFGRSGRYFIWAADGYTQHFPVFCYIRDYWQALLSSILQGRPQLPLYSLSLGLGGDIWNILNYYGLGNIFYLPAVFVPEHSLPLAFSLLVVLQFCLGGLAFYALARKLGAGRWGAVLGGWLYAFSGFYGLAVQHPIMAHAIVYLPLLLLGCEKLLRRENPLLLGLTVFFFALSGFYFLFISSIVLMFYVLIRTWQLRGEGSYWSGLWRGALRSLAAYLSGLLLAFVVFLPQVLAYLGSSRAGTKQLPPLFGGFGALTGWLHEILLPTEGAFVGAMALLTFALVLGGLLHSRKAWGPAAAGLAVVLVFVLSPLAQSALVGFGDSQFTRFWFAIALFAAILLALSAEKLFCLERWQRRCCAAVPVLALLLCLPGGLEPPEKGSLLFLAALTAALLLGQKAYWSRRPARAQAVRRLSACALTLLLAGNLSWGLYVQARELPVSSYRDGRFARLMAPVTSNELPEGLYRVDVSDVALHRWWASANVALTGGYNGLSAYYSILDGNYTRAMLQDWALAPAQQGGFSFQSLDGCAALNALAGVRYTFIREGEEDYVPYGYAHVGEQAQSSDFTFTPDGGPMLQRYENLFSLPFAYSYDSVLDEEEYAALNGLEKQAACLQLAAVADAPEQLPRRQPDLEGVSLLESRVLPSSTVSWEDGVLTVPGDGDDDGILELALEVPAGTELHLALRGLKLINCAANTRMSLSLNGGIEREVYLHDSLNTEEAWVNLGWCAEGGQGRIRLAVPSGTVLELDSMEAWSYDMQQFDRDATLRQQAGLQNILMENNSIQGLSVNDKDSLACFAVPWSEGWQASVDGRPVQAMRANSLFTAVPVPAGEHAVRLVYRTPGMKLGAVCSLLGAFTLGLQWLWWLLRRKKR